jgi:7-cyano-7-deazaguanine synthase in queuosine biosynthesis
MKKLLISFSGGRTSAYMTDWLLKNKRDEYDMIVVFANTGKEREETLEFVRECDTRMHFNTVWIEAETSQEVGVGIKARIVSFETANRTGAPFEQMIKKHGIPNRNKPACSRELKNRAIKAYARSIGWRKYYTAIGIRADEFDRMSDSRVKDRIVYPLISMKYARREDVNAFWMAQPFDLQLKSYEGNCDVCWKKSLRKLMTIAKERPELFEWWAKMEDMYSTKTPDRFKKGKGPQTFFREKLTAREILEMSKKPFEPATDESKDLNYQTRMFDDYKLDASNGCEESCEAF